MATNIASAVSRLRIVAFNDCYDLHQLPRLQTFISRLSPAPKCVVLAGDFLSPSTLSSIDGGRGMVAALRSVGTTHVSLGNHEQDLNLNSLHDRLAELSKTAVILNSNIRQDLPSGAEWMNEITKPYDIVKTPCGKVKVALFGLLSDEEGIFKDDRFKGMPIANVLDTYTNYHQSLVPSQANYSLALTHQSLVRDMELANHVLNTHGGETAGLLIGGHEHEPYDEVVKKEGIDNGVLPGVDTMRIVKSGMDCNAVNLIDLSFDVEDEKSPKLVEASAELVEMAQFEPSVVVKKIVDKHMAVLDSLENEVIVDISTIPFLPPGVPISSERTRFQQTTLGSIFCTFIKEELETDVAILNGAVIKGGRVYDNGRLSYSDLKKELPFPTKMVIVSGIKRWELLEAIHYSRTALEPGTNPDADEIPRRGYLQVDWQFEQNGAIEGHQDDELTVAMPRNLLNGFCNIEPLMEIGKRLKKKDAFPGDDDFVPAIQLVVRHSCKNRWSQLVTSVGSFEEADLNNDGVLDRNEIRKLMEKVLGRSDISDFVVDDMIDAIDTDNNGVIDMGEFSYLLAMIERERQQW